MKRICSILLTVCFFLLLIPQITLADEEYGDWRYRVLEDGTVAITGYCNLDGNDIVIPAKILGKTVSAIEFRDVWDYDDVEYLLTGSLTIPNGVTIVGNPFGYQIAYEFPVLSIHVAPDHPTLEMVDGCLIDKTEKRLITTTSEYTRIPDGVEILGACCGVFIDDPLPDSVKKIEHGAFRSLNMTRTVQVTIPGSVTKLEGNPFAYATHGKKKIILEKDHPTLEIVDDVLYDKEERRLICTTADKGRYNILAGTVKIERNAFQGKKTMSTLILPDSVKEIGSRAFDSCSNLTSISLPDGIRSIENYSFMYCEKIKSINIPDSITAIGAEAFFGCKNLQDIIIPEGVASIESGTFYECEKLRSITIPDSVTSIGNHAFYGCASLQSITIPDSVRSIGWYAFENCEKLKEITIGNGIEDVDNPFVGCKNVRALTISGSIARWNFSDELTAKIQTVVLGEGTESVEPGIFKNFTSLEKVTIPGSVRSIGESAFEGLKKLKSVEIGDGVVSIGRNAFADCPNLKKITIPDSVKTIHDSSFNQKQLTMTVGQGSVAEKYCVEHNIKYTYAK